MSESGTIWAEFGSADDLVSAARALRDRGARLRDSYTPYALPELDQVLGLDRPIGLSVLTFLAAASGGTGAYLIIWWTAAVSYPLNVGGRPLNSFIADIPIIFESSVLAAAVTAFFAFLFSNRLPRLTHPLEGQPGFRDTSIDRFWLGIQVERPDAESFAAELLEMGALGVRAELEHGA